MRKVIACHPDDEAATRGALDALRSGIYETHPILRVNAFVPRGQVLIFDDPREQPVTVEGDGQNQEGSA